jgi:hypothetical protein
MSHQGTLVILRATYTLPLCLACIPIAGSCVAERGAYSKFDGALCDLWPRRRPLWTLSLTENNSSLRCVYTADIILQNGPGHEYRRGGAADLRRGGRR